ncbi:hypothetical protein GSI_02117 [Ganoderma sinense ZZ0214-1]|uniref:Transporter n=1 Tax=Ganoderma sinense ZZ0214-1 TaxID=1077348 RepID=A0A2G8SNQ3_9APHY|nr:hypothetical protein GSI_02117 [Ganoderma sinense ZZ0214-1]
MLAPSSRTFVLLLTGAILFGTTDARMIAPKPDLEPPAVTVPATAPIYAHTQPPEQRIKHTIVGRQDTAVTKPLNDPSSVSSLL